MQPSNDRKFDPDVVLDNADEDNTKRTLNESQDHTIVSEEGPCTNEVPSTEDSDGTDNVPSECQAETYDADKNTTEASA